MLIQMIHNIEQNEQQHHYVHYVYRNINTPLIGTRGTNKTQDKTFELLKMSVSSPGSLRKGRPVLPLVKQKIFKMCLGEANLLIILKNVPKRSKYSESRQNLLLKAIIFNLLFFGKDNTTTSCDINIEETNGVTTNLIRYIPLSEIKFLLIKRMYINSKAVPSPDNKRDV